MKILLINPPRYNELVGKNPSIIEHNRGYNPPLGIMALAASIKKFRPGADEVTLIDCQPRQLSYEWMEYYLSKEKFDLAGITTMTFTLLDVVRTAEIIKRRIPGCAVALGGPHTHIFPNETINLPNVDYLAQGEGEYAIIDLLEAMEGKRAFSTVRGLVYKENGAVRNNGIAPKIEDLDALPFPDRSLLPVEHYGSLLGRNSIVTTMFTSRGCPYRCAFCDRPRSPIISGFRWRGAEGVVEEMEQCLALGINEILIYDDTFTVRKERVHQICDMILSRGLKIVWDVRAHVNTMDEPMLKAMKRAGCERIHYGIEAGNNRLLRELRKNTTVERVRQTIDLTKKAGIEALAYFMIGNPTETSADIDDTLRLAESLKPHYCHFTIFCPYPATEFYERGLAEGHIKQDVWRLFATAPGPDFQLPVWEEHFTRAELYEKIVMMYKKFYLRPWHVMGQLMRIRSMGEFKRKARAGFQVLRMKAAEVARLDLSKSVKMK